MRLTSKAWVLTAVAVTLAATTALVADAQNFGRTNAGGEVVPSPTWGPTVLGSVSIFKQAPEVALPLSTAAAARSIAGLLTADSPGVSSDLLPGTSNGDARLLQSGLGTRNLSLVAFSTSKGSVCLEVIDGSSGLGGCDRAFLAGQPATATLVGVRVANDGSADDTPLYLYGLAADDVASVEVTYRGEARSVAVVNNSYFWQAPSRESVTDAPSAVLVLANGTRVPFGLPVPSAIPKG